MRVPFLDLKSHHEALQDEILAAIREVIESSAFAGGPFVARFEEDFAAYCQTRFAIGVGSGTDALWLALLACGVGAGDEVITVPNSFLATAEAISFSGATPIFVDVNPRTYTMDPALLQAAITPRTKAIIPVHLFGQMADMDPIMEIARVHKLIVIEDACQAHGAEYKGRRAGSIGNAGCFSFYPGKNLGALGEAGAVVSNDAALQERIRLLRDHGQRAKYYHSHVGWNARMDGIQGAVLRVKLKGLDRHNAARRSHAQQYDNHLGRHGDLITPKEAEYGTHVYHVYAVRVKGRDQLQRTLTDQGIATGIHYPIPIHLQEAYAHLKLGRGSYPVAEHCADEFLSLPMFPELTPEQIGAVAGEIQSHLSRSQNAGVCAV
ncbi:MAG TPA: DegT/DnrJ/EryC1/StrS family aminotransferase [Verrucomicrobiae bacterium]|nr:DegT/DnrJ/EryC1/StrS family aminotransferase [Verrucomicrobiae bacterium]